MSQFRTFGRPINNGFKRRLDEHTAVGMEIITRNMRSVPTKLRQELKLEPEHFAVCGFMGHRNLKNMGPIGEAIYLYTKKMGQMEDKYGAGFALLSGGGMPDPSNPEKSGYMGQWVRGVSESDQLGRFLTLQELIILEGIKKGYGRAICLQNLYGEARYGERTDGLLCAGDGFITWPGGLGTLLEVYDYFVSFLSPGFDRRKMIFVDPLITDPVTGETSRLMKYDGPMLHQRILTEGIGELAVQRLNNNCVRYQPRLGMSAEEISDELVTLTVAMRQAAVRFSPEAGYLPLPPSLIQEHLHPIGKNGSKLKPLFKKYPVRWDWLDGVFKKRKIGVKPRTANHEFVGRVMRPTRNGGHVVLG
ncbi:MAG: hypothetical protein AB7E52_02920 [Bdellovibrionales bacterium]